MTTWSNWDGEQRCTPSRVERPTTEQQVADAVKRARADGLTVRAVGSGHSFTPCALTDGVLLDLTGLNRIEDVQGNRVTVQGGTRLHALGPQLADRGLSLTNQGDIDVQSITGAISTSTHGTGVRFGNLSSQVVGVRLVDANGDVRSLEGGDELLAARVSLGALGVITAVTVECSDLFTLHRHDAPAPLDETLAGLDSHVDGNDHFEFFVFPYTRTALTRTTRRSHETPKPTPQWKRTLHEDVLENRALQAICRTGRRFPSRVPALNRLIARAMSESRVEDRAHRIFATERRVRFTEMEYAIPRAHAREAVERILDAIESARLPILFPLELRFSAGDDAFLSTAHAQETAYIAVHQFQGMAYEPLFRLAEAVFDDYGGRPHWGKRHFQTADTLQARYPAWAGFQAVRQKLDPDGVFANPYTRTVFSAGTA